MKTQEITRTREEGTKVTNTMTATNPGLVRINAIRDVVERKQYAKIDGVMVDGFSASAIIQVYDAINDENKEKFRNLSVGKMAEIAFKLCK